MNLGRHSIPRLGAIVLACVTCFTTSAFAVDGVVLIDQARALAGNVTPGDAPGLPVTISVPGSYRLSGNLNVPLESTGIEITADNVTLDLNGFLIAGSGNGAGVNDIGERRGIAVRNGSVTNFTTGIDLGETDNAEITQVRATNCSFFGIVAGTGSNVTGNFASKNVVGIRVEFASTVSGNTIVENGQLGMQLLAFSTVTGNTVVENGLVGMQVNCPANLINNTVLLNHQNIQEIGPGCTRANNNAPIPIP